ncbi:hypothetical protein V2J09_021169 [Rumex salicifolius]
MLMMPCFFRRVQVKSRRLFSRCNLLRHLGVVGPDIVSFIQQWWNGQIALDEINHMVVALIPKIFEPKYIAEF